MFESFMGLGGRSAGRPQRRSVDAVREASWCEMTE